MSVIYVDIIHVDVIYMDVVYVDAMYMDVVYVDVIYVIYMDVVYVDVIYMELAGKCLSNFLFGMARGYVLFVSLLYSSIVKWSGRNCLLLRLLRLIPPEIKRPGSTSIFALYYPTCKLRLT